MGGDDTDRQPPQDPRLPSLTVLVFLTLMRAAAIGTAVVALIARADCAFVFGTCSIRNLLGYFTIESALIFTAVIAAAGMLTVLQRDVAWFDVVRVIAASYVIVSGLVFAVLMSTAGYTGAEFLVPLSSRVLHFVLPAFAVADIMADPPFMPLSRLWAVLVFPALWLTVTLLRGSATGWYPYFFVSPEAAGGYPVIAGYAIGLAGILLGTALAVRWLTRKTAASRS